MLRQSLLPLVALQARDPQVRTRLVAAAEAFVAGDESAIDPAYRANAMRVAVQDKGLPFMRALLAKLLASNDPLFRGQACAALAAADRPELVDAALKMALEPKLQSLDTVQIILSLAYNPQARDKTVAFAGDNFDRLLERFPGFARTQLVAMFDGYCTAADAVRADAFITPRLKTLGGGELELAQTKERIMLCAALKSARGAEIATALAAY